MGRLNRYVRQVSQLQEVLTIKNKLIKTLTDENKKLKDEVAKKSEQEVRV